MKPSPPRAVLRPPRSRLRLWLAAAGLVALCSCASGSSFPDHDSAELLADPVHDFSNYRFDPARPLMQRTGDMPEVFLDYLRRVDKRPDYSAHVPTRAERPVFERALRSLPADMRAALEQRLIGYYFVNDMIGNGFAEWVRGPDGRIYSLLAIHPRMLGSTTASDYCTQRERSIYVDFVAKAKSGHGRPAPKADLVCQIKGRTGLDYLLLHESVHALDYAARISPYVDPVSRAVQPKSRYSFAAFTDYWQGYDRPRAGHDFALRERITVYGLRGGPKLDLQQADELYTSLAKSPFASLYGAQNWAEDLAELVSLGQLCGASGGDCFVEVKLDGRTRRYPLISSPVARARLRQVSDRIRATRL